jgi:hypothetical protein
LYEVLETPLMLSVAALAYHDVAAAGVGAGTVQERRARLYAAYVDRAFRRRSAETRYTRAQCERLLAWLAKEMTAHEQTVFYLERMQPDWLPTRVERWTVTWGAAIASGLISALCGGLVFDLFRRGIRFGLVGALFGGLTGGLALGYSREIEPAEMLRWSWARARAKWRAILFLGLVSGLAFGLVFGLGLGPASGLFFGLLFALVGGLVVGLGHGLVLDELGERTRPNQGIRRSVHSGGVVGVAVGLAGGAIGGVVGALIVGLSGWLGGGGVAGLILGLFQGLIIGLPGGLAFGLFAGLVVGLQYGWRASLQHLVLRGLLRRRGWVPRRYVRFLDYATERVLLRKVGGGYVFVHRTLMAWFAGRWEESKGLF